MLYSKRVLSAAMLLLVSIDVRAQYKGDHIPGFIGLQSGSQPPPGLYVGNLVYVYPTDTIKDHDGNSVPLPGDLTTTADAILVNLVTNYKLFVGRVGGSIGFPIYQKPSAIELFRCEFKFCIYRYVRRAECGLGIEAC